jgi:predicted HTH domain antitoxin
MLHADINPRNRRHKVSTKIMTLTIPDSLARELDSASQEFYVEVLERGLRDLKIEQALERYARGGMTFGAAARQAGVSQSELARHAHARGMEPPFSAETLAEELD